MKILIVSKKATKKYLEWQKNISLANVYKKCGFKRDKDVEKRHTWKHADNLFISVYARDSGRANTENKYELPPPIDKQLYFGSMMIIAHTDEVPTDSNLKDLTEELWNTAYEKLMGGFEDLGKEDSYSEEEYVAPENLTAQGYEKDGFVVEDGEEIEKFSSENSDADGDWNDCFNSSTEKDSNDSLEEEEQEEEDGGDADETKTKVEDDEDEDDDTEENEGVESEADGYQLTSDKDTSSELSEEAYEY